MKTLTNIKSQIALEIMQLPKIAFNYHQDNEQELLDLIESNGYCEPSQIGSTAEAYDLCWSELSRNISYDMPDFSNCNSSFECIELEGQAILDAAYYEAKCEIVKEIANALDECFSHNFVDYEITEMYIGKSGLGHISHDYEIDIADSSMYVWIHSKMVELTVNGVSLYGKLEKVEGE